MQRAYSILTVKDLDPESREISGVATTPSTDRMGDIVEPKGVQFRLPIPLLWQHSHNQPIGHVVAANVTSAGIEVRAKMAKVAEPGPLKDRLDEAWQAVKSGLVRGLSIGFRALEVEAIADSFAQRFTRWEWLELSAVTVPANADCSITMIRSADQAYRRAAFGAKPIIRLDRISSACADNPGVSGPPRRKGVVYISPPKG